MSACDETDLSAIAVDFIGDGGVASKQYTNAFKCYQQTTPDMSIKVNPGRAYVPGTNQAGRTMVWAVEADAVNNVTLDSSHASWGRYDLICIKIDTSVSANSDASNVMTVVKVTGTASGSPAVPATPANHYRLARVYVGPNVSSITNANIQDNRAEAGPLKTGGWNVGDYKEDSVTSTDAPTLLRFYGAATSGRLGTPPNVDSVGKFKIQSGSRTQVVDSNSCIGITLQRAFPGGMLSCMVCDGHADGGALNFGKTLGIVNGGTSIGYVRVRITRGSNDASLTGNNVRVEYIIIGW
jgi:hypothetical protein